ncbi:hypothetical protein AVEN_86949-1 [Araneus ventricosus]|uniref:Uncharacterized protein n=1 Tax=Araneus ventricosus TaxID=182803 RepID=A0A4Y2UZS6_ARAVE|nr:hypothetical protein AVEN_69999-1 [Araneus ventricosus]GBO17299.1 hypothetical protein AVEN_86949-1 [Araneus ventricosus]
MREAETGETGFLPFYWGAWCQIDPCCARVSDSFRSGAHQPIRVVQARKITIITPFSCGATKDARGLLLLYFTAQQHKLAGVHQGLTLWLGQNTNVRSRDEKNTEKIGINGDTLNFPSPY